MTFLTILIGFVWFACLFFGKEHNRTCGLIVAGIAFILLQNSAYYEGVLAKIDQTVKAEEKV